MNLPSISHTFPFESELKKPQKTVENGFLPVITENAGFEIGTAVSSFGASSSCPPSASSFGASSTLQQSSAVPSAKSLMISANCNSSAHSHTKSLEADAHRSNYSAKSSHSLSDMYMPPQMATPIKQEVSSCKTSRAASGYHPLVHSTPNRYFVCVFTHFRLSSCHCAACPPSLLVHNSFLTSVK